MHAKGKFIVFEGIDGSGKSTRAKDLVGALNATGRPAVYTAEPYNSQISHLPPLIHSLQDSPKAQALLFTAIRVQHIEDFVNPNLAKGKIVVCDRHIMSTLAYQNTPQDTIWMKAYYNFSLTSGASVLPTLTIYLDVEPETAIQRVLRRDGKLESLDKLSRVRDVYLHLCDKSYFNAHIINANLGEEDVNREINKHVKKALSGN